jgi:hypothetical protein
MPIHIVTVMRCGQNYLQTLLTEETDLTWTHSHKYTGQQGRIVTIARDPFDSLVSRLTMQKILNKNMTNAYILDMINENLETYNLLAKHSKIVIDYIDLVSNPLGVVNYLTKALGGHAEKHNLNLLLTDDLLLGYFVSSKISKEYEEVSDMVKLLDLSELYKAYQPLYEQTVIIDT